MGPGKVAVDIGKTPFNSPLFRGRRNVYLYDRSGEEVVIKVEMNPKHLYGFTRCDHVPQNGRIVYQILNSGVSLDFSGGLDDVTSVSIYYWNGDLEYKHPLIIHLNGRSNGYYRFEEGEGWVKFLLTKNQSSILDVLDRQNCAINGAHILDFLNDEHSCPVCSEKIFSIKVSSSPKYYISRQYTLHYRVSISRFREGKEDHVGLPSLKNVDKFFTFSNHDSGPLLIFIPLEPIQWYGRYREDSVWTPETALTTPRNEWQPECIMNDHLAHHNDHYGMDVMNDHKIQELLEEYEMPSIDIDIFQGEGRYTSTWTIFALNLERIPIPEHFLHKYNFGSKRLKRFKVGSVTQNGDVLNGVSASGVVSGLIVYYSDLDKSESLPLAISLVLEKDAYRYFRRGGSSVWVRCPEGTDEETLYTQLKPMYDELQGTTILQLNRIANASYTSNVDIPGSTNKTYIKVSMESRDESGVYERLTHRSSNGTSMNILTTKNGANYVQIPQQFLLAKCLEAYIYFWSQDVKHEHPLMLELKSDRSCKSLSFVYENYKWKNIKMRTSTRELLDKQNCLINGAHIVDISRVNDYKCPSCKAACIGVTTNDIQGVSISKHRTTCGQFSISSFLSGMERQDGLPSARNVHAVYIFWNMNGSSNGRPILICIHYGGEHHWYTSSRGGHSWELEKSLEGIPPSDHSGIILKTLKLSRDSTGHTVSTAYGESRSGKAAVTMAMVIGVMVGCMVGLEVIMMIKIPRRSWIVRMVDRLRGYHWNELDD